MVNIAKVIKMAKKAYKLYKKHQQKQAGADGGGGGGGGGGTASRDAGLMDVATQALGMAGGNKWKLSNIGGIGSKEDTVLRKQAAEGEPEFAGAGSSVGIEVWRIEKFKRKLYMCDMAASPYTTSHLSCLFACC